MDNNIVVVGCCGAVAGPAGIVAAVAADGAEQHWPQQRMESTTRRRRKQQPPFASESSWRNCSCWMLSLPPYNFFVGRKKVPIYGKDFEKRDGAHP